VTSALPRSITASVSNRRTSMHCIEAESEPAPRMVAGVALHDLEEFPQKLRHTRTLASLHRIGARMQRSLVAVARRRNAFHGAVICGSGGASEIQCGPRVTWRLARPPDHGGFYSVMGSSRRATSSAHPYLEGPDDGKLWVQPMILNGEALARLTASVRMQTIDARDDYHVIRFGQFGIGSGRVSLRRTTAAVAARAPDGAIIGHGRQRGIFGSDLTDLTKPLDRQARSEPNPSEEEYEF